MATAKHVDTRWLQAQLQERKLSQRKVAKYLKIEASALSRALRGLRKIKQTEAVALASLLSIPIGELLFRFGIEVTPPPGYRVPVVGWIDSDGRAHMCERSSAELVPAPPFKGAVALRDQSGTAREGWLMYYKPMKCVGAKAIGRLSVVELHDTGEILVRKLKYNSGFDGYVLIAMDGTASDTVPIKTASPIWWVKP